jgi:hypothetical protein
MAAGEAEEALWGSTLSPAPAGALWPRPLSFPAPTLHKPQQARWFRQRVSVLDQVQPAARFHARQGSEQGAGMLAPEGLHLGAQLVGAGGAEGLRQQADTE